MLLNRCEELVKELTILASGTEENDLIASVISDDINQLKKLIRS